MFELFPNKHKEKRGKEAGCCRVKSICYGHSKSPPASAPSLSTSRLRPLCFPRPSLCGFTRSAPRFTALLPLLLCPQVLNLPSSGSWTSQLGQGLLSRWVFVSPHNYNWYSFITIVCPDPHMSVPLDRLSTSWVELLSKYCLYSNFSLEPRGLRKCWLNSTDVASGMLLAISWLVSWGHHRPQCSHVPLAVGDDYDRSESINYYCFARISVPHVRANYKLLKGIWFKRLCVFGTD